MDIKQQFGEAVRTKRKALGLSQEDLAYALKMDQAYISRIELGQMNVTLDTADEITKALGVKLADLVG